MQSILTVAIVTFVAQAEPDRFDINRTLARGDEILTPQSAVERAWEVAPELDEAQARVDAARAAVRSAQVPLVPRIALSGNVQRIGGFPDGAIRTPAGDVSIEVPRTRAGVTAELLYPLMRLFFGVLPKLKSRRAREEAEAYQAAAAREELALRALESYWTHAEARGGLAVARASLQQAESQRDRLVAMEGAGLATVADVAAAEARLAEAMETVVRAQGADVVARSNFALLLALPERDTAFPAQVLIPPPTSSQTRARLEELATASRPELQAIDAALIAAEADRRGVWSDRLPGIDIKGGVTYAQPNPNVIPPAERFDPSWEVGAQLTWSPNGLWSAENEDDRLEADVRRLQSERARTWRGIRIEIRTELENMETSRRAWSAAEARVRAAEEAYAARSAAFEPGRAIFTEVLEADTELSAARLSQLDALVDAHLARARLDRAVGRLGVSAAPR